MIRSKLRINSQIKLSPQLDNEVVIFKSVICSLYDNVSKNVYCLLPQPGY